MLLELNPSLRPWNIVYDPSLSMFLAFDEKNRLVRRVSIIWGGD